MKYDAGIQAKALKKKEDDNHDFSKVTPETYGMMEGPSKPKPHYPEFRLKLKDIPEAKDWEVGKQYKIELIVEQVMLSERKDEDGQVEFCIMAVNAGEEVDERVEPEKEKKKNKKKGEDDEEYDDTFD